MRCFVKYWRHWVVEKESTKFNKSAELINFDYLTSESHQQWNHMLAVKKLLAAIDTD